MLLAQSAILDDLAALRERLEKANGLLRWWADRSMATSGLSERGVTSQMERQEATESYLASMPSPYPTREGMNPVERLMADAEDQP